MRQLLDQQAFSEALASARQSRHGGMHPFSVAWARGEFLREQLGQWAIQHFSMLSGIHAQFGLRQAA